MSCHSQAQSDRRLGFFTRIFLSLLLVAMGGFMLASLPEMKRYIRISTM